MRGNIMKKLAAFLAFAMILTGIAPARQVEAAGLYKKFPTYTRYENKYGKSGMTADNGALEKLLAAKTYKYVYLRNVKTAETYTIPANSNFAEKRLRINAPLSKVVNHASSMKVVKITKVESWTEYGKGNSFAVVDEKAKFEVGTGATVDKLYFQADNGEVALKVQGDVKKTGFYGDKMEAEVTISQGTTKELRVAAEDSKVNVTVEKTAEVSTVKVVKDADITLNVNDGVEKVVVDAPANVTITGDSEKVKEVAVEVGEKAEGAKVASDVPVKAEVAAKAEITLKEGAEESTVKKADEKVAVEVKNDTKKDVTVSTEGSSKTEVVESTKKDTTGGGTGGGSGSSGTGGNTSGSNTPSPDPGPVIPTPPTPPTPTPATDKLAIQALLTPATLEDTTSGAVKWDADDLIKNYGVSIDSSDSSKGIVIQLSGTDLKAHWNDASPKGKGYWVGFGIKADAEGSVITSSGIQYKWNSETDYKPYAAPDDMVVNGVSGKYYAFYVNVKDSATGQQNHTSVTISCGGIEQTYQIDVTGVELYEPKFTVGVMEETTFAGQTVSGATYGTIQFTPPDANGKITVTGVLKQMSGANQGFSRPNEKNGYCLAYTIAAPDELSGRSIKISVEKILPNTAGGEVCTWTYAGSDDFEQSGSKKVLNYVMCVANATGEAISQKKTVGEFFVGAEAATSFKITLSWGDSALEKTTYSIDYSGLFENGALKTDAKEEAAQADTPVNAAMLEPEAGKPEITEE